jgi:hypothetical protein
MHDHNMVAVAAIEPASNDFAIEWAIDGCAMRTRHIHGGVHPAVEPWLLCTRPTPKERAMGEFGTLLEKSASPTLWVLGAPAEAATPSPR